MPAIESLPEIHIDTREKPRAPKPPGALGRLWKRHSSRYELILSSMAAWAIHAVIIVGLLWFGSVVTNRSAEPARLDVVVASAGPAGAPGFGTDGLAPGNNDGKFGSSLASPTPSSDIISGPAAFIPDKPPIALADSLPKPPDVDLSKIGLSGSVFSSSGGMLATPGGEGGGRGGSGGGGGAASGFGAGAGTTQFFGAFVSGNKFVYVIDRSGSMSERNKMESAKRELLDSVAQLAPEAQFQVIFYNLRVDVLSISAGAKRLVYATDANKAVVRRKLGEIIPEGGTEHLPALKAALGLNPDVIFFLTDADDLREREVKDATDLNKGRAQIHTIEFGTGAESERPNTLRKLAEQNRGTYRYVDTGKSGAAGSE